MEGWLDKRYPLRWGKWPRRWCVLSRERLCYYQCQVDEKAERHNLCGWIEIQPGSTVARFRDEGAPGDAKHHRSEKPFGFVLLVHEQQADERFFYFSALDEQSMQDWVQAIQNLAKCLGKRLVSRRTTLRHSVLGGLSAPAGGVFHGKDSRPVWEVYEQEARLGSGAFGTVFRARERETGRVVALKHLPCSSEQAVEEDAVAEFMLCARVAHPHVLRVFSFFAAPDAVYIASELASRGELLDFLTRNKEFASESGVVAICSQVLSALVYLHGQDMVHHDVKPPNILVTDQVCHQSQEALAQSVKPVLPNGSREDFAASFGGVAAGLVEPLGAGSEAAARAASNGAVQEVPLVVLGDFGTARLCRSSSLGQHGKPGGGILGTPEYCGPEVFEGKTGDKTDVYALGITLFELLAGCKPFEQQFDIFASGGTAAGGDDRFHQMRDLSFEADWALLRGVSERGCNLVRRMMAKAFADRPSAVECSEDGWFSAFSPSGGLVLEEERNTRAERLLRRANLGFYAKVLMNMMATQISGELLQKERTVFRLLDVDKSGAISVEELLAAFGKMGLSQERAAMVLRSYDVDRSGALGFNEWLGATMFLDVQDSQELMGHVRALFKQLDADGCGIALEDLRRYFGEQNEDNCKALEAFFDELDADEDGVVSLDEFVRFWKDVA